MCRRIFKEQTSENGEIPFYKIGTFGGEADAFISRELFEEYKAKYQYPKKGDILISASGSIGRTVVFTGKNEYFQDSNIVWLNHDKHLDNSFLKCFYSIVKWAGIEGSTIKRLYNDNILNTAITLPSVEEQQKIGAYFENLDNLITLHQREFAFLCKEKSKKFRYIKNAWEQRKLGEVLISLQNNTLSRADLSSEEGIAKNIHYGDILVKFGEVIDVKTESLPMISDETVIAKYKSSFLQNGDVIVADTAEDETVGKCTEIAGLSDEIVISGLHTIPYRPLQKYAPGYLGYYMNSASFHNQLLPLMQGIKVTSISKTALQNTDILYPKSATEQAAIGTYFRNLDNLITLHQRKYDKLTNVKKSMLEKMFPQNGSNAPEIRFKGFTEAWEQRKVREVTDRYDNLRIPVAASLRVAGTTPYYGANGIQDYVDGYTHDGEFILVAEDGANDLKNYPVKCVKGRIWVNNHAHVLQGKYDCADNQFLAYAISQADIESLLVGGGRAKLNAETLMGIDLLLPNKAEQIRIGKYLAQLDNLITLHQRELEKLKNLKKACLEKMFV